MKKILCYLMIIMLIFTFVSCTNNKDENTDISNQEENSSSIDEQNINEIENQVDDKDGNDDILNDKIEETIEIEGMEEKIILNLFKSDLLNFRTYIPSDFIAEESSNSEGNELWIYSNFEGVKREDVYLQFYFFPKTVNEEPNIEENSTFATLLEGLEPIYPEDKYYNWSIKEFTSPNSAKYAALGEHEGRYFVVIKDYPFEFADGIEPRINKTFKHFYWIDTEEYLSKE